MGRLKDEPKQTEKAPTLEEVVELRQTIADVLELQAKDGELSAEQYAIASIGLKLGYLIAASIVSIAESQRVLAAEATLAMNQPEAEEPDRFETL